MSEMRIVLNPRPCSTFIHVADDPLVLTGEVLALMLPPPQQHLLLDLGLSS
jgi:hypothetical protein